MSRQRSLVLAFVLLAASSVSAQGSWFQSAQLFHPNPASQDHFGFVAFDGNLLAVGAPDDTHSGKTGAGSVSVFTKIGATWSAPVQVIAPTPQAGAAFGYRVALSGSTLVGGAPLENLGSSNDAGAAWVFDLVGSTWTFRMKLTADVIVADDLFGSSVSIDVDDVVVGSPGDDTAAGDAGCVYVFGRNQGGAGKWGQTAKLFTTDASTGDTLGEAVDIEGSRFVVGSTGNDPSASQQDAGAAYVFVRSGSTWSQERKLVANGASAADYGGWSVSISGDTVAVAAPEEEDPGANDTGSVNIYVRDPQTNTWSEQAKVRPCGLHDLDGFGESVSLSQDTLVVGSPHADPPNNTDRGEAWVFDRVGTTWNTTARLTAIDGRGGDAFGISVASVPGAAVIGAGLDDLSGAADAGSAYVFDLGANGTPFCFGDNSAVACPCGNATCGGEGCANSVAKGARLYDSGGTSYALDDVVLTAIQMPANRNGLIFMGSAPFPLPFGDGLLCVPFPKKRFPLQNTGANGTFTQLGPVANSNGVIAPGSTWTFQAWFQDPSGPCAKSVNLSNALLITFQ